MDYYNEDMQDALVAARSLHKAYQSSGGRTQALTDVNLEIHAGEMVALVGPTGSGKTSLLSILAGLEPADEGSVWLLGQDLDDLNADGLTELRSRATGMIYQNYNLFPGFTVLENVGLPLRLMMRPPYDAHQRSVQLVAESGLSDLTNRYPPELSGGQQQMVAIARALAAKPPLILADEPTANLDSQTARKIMSQLRTLVDSGEHGVLIATHDLRMASQADRVLNMRDGKIVKETALRQGREVREVLAELV